MLVTHRLSFLPYVDQILVLVDGCITEVGTYTELLQQNGAFSDILRMYLNMDANGDDGSDISGTQ